MTELILSSIGVFLVVILLLVIILLVAKQYLTPSGNVKITINGEREVEVESGSNLLSTLAVNKIFLPSACGGGGSCAQCRCQVENGGGEILPTEKVHFSRKEQQANWRLGCQVKVKQDMEIKIDESILGVKKWECEVVSNRNVSTYIKEFVVRLPKGEHLKFISGGYIQIDIPKYDIKYSDYQIEDRFREEWEKFKLFDLTCKNTEETMRAYSMANYPAEGDIVMLNVRIATPPFDRVNGGFQKVSPGISSSYIFSLKPGDKVMVSGPFGEFHPLLDTGREMLYVGGGAGMAPLRSHILHLLRTLKITDRKISYWYGARALNEVFYMEDFLELEKQFPNFSFHLALDRQDPVADEAGVKYTAGFVHEVILNNYLKDHEAPEDIEYYMCGPGPMAKAVEKMLYDLGVPRNMLMFDDFG
ncbi:NADH:ubiquinone reductase (Na(+)-transporting) subunit F [Bacteroides sp. 214]|uniref:NADH:ubiquinone reductase (Na(+)-transporting) subunit F n=1 Tax=Bacteroides sp. 214 TaxID=2302935 RepID=UPI0013D4578A|nr:NADH:ubiquinone reductase (Na(+)-transporting) subunit F [Bacteroides sp. 214]NDW12761.1 NADH:ubiquinone reductase (Na(+)-transporting) subunit F [Bacteroides sp. 214]